MKRYPWERPLPKRFILERFAFQSSTIITTLRLLLSSDDDFFITFFFSAFAQTHGPLLKAAPRQVPQPPSIKPLLGPEPRNTRAPRSSIGWARHTLSCLQSYKHARVPRQSPIPRSTLQCPTLRLTNWVCGAFDIELRAFANRTPGRTRGGGAEADQIEKIGKK